MALLSAILASLSPKRSLAATSLLLALAAIAYAPVVRADEEPPPKTLTGDYSSYERESIDDALKARDATIDDSPEGKTIEGVDVEALDVIEKRDPAPGFLNYFHARSRPYVIEREVLLGVGDRYRQALVDETARNLRDLIQLSLVVVVPMRGSAPDKVRLLVITKDVWSLRLNSDFRIAGGKLEYLLLQPSEWNVAGTHQTVGAQLVWQPLSYSLGARYQEPRLWGSRVALASDANVIISSKQGKPEGSYGAAAIGQPLFSARTEWAWQVAGAWRDEVNRRYSNGELKTYDAKATDFDDKIPFQYRSSVYTSVASITRSFGWATKNDAILGFEANRRAYHTFDLSAFDPRAAAEFNARFLPIGDTRVNPFIEYRGYTSDFLRVLDFETLGLQEDFRLGHELDLKLYPVSTSLGSSRTFMGVSAAAQYTVPLGDGLARAAIESIVESQSDGVADALVEGKERAVTPRLGFGRLVFDAHQLYRPRNSLNRLSFLGGEGRLRGYPTHYAFGKNVVAYSLEFRTRPLELLSTELGAAFFYDTGDAYDDFSQIDLKHSVGFGLRALFPQLDQLVFRVDVGFPIACHGLPPGVSPVQVVLTFDQAFSMPVLTRGTVFTDR